MKKQVKIAAAITAAACAAGVTAAQAVFHMSVARDVPRVSKKKKDDPIWLAREQAQRELEQRPHEIVAITSRDGLRLIGHWFAGEHPRRTVVMVHGWHSTWAWDFGAHAAFLQDCNLLLIEQRSHGASEGEYIGFGVLERYDCLDWLEFLRTKTGDTLPVYLFGISMGAATVLMTTGLQPKIQGVIADCGFTSPKEIITYVMRKGNQCLPHVLYQLVNAMTRLRAGYGLADYSTLDAMAANTCPVLFIHGDADNFVPLAMTVQNYEACRARKMLLVVEGAGHATSYLTAPELYRRTVLEFFRRCEENWEENP